MSAEWLAFRAWAGSGVGGRLRGGLVPQPHSFFAQNPPQTGEQELESLVLKLSVLKDFLSGIQKKVP